MPLRPHWMFNKKNLLSLTRYSKSLFRKDFLNLVNFIVNYKELKYFNTISEKYTKVQIVKLKIRDGSNSFTVPGALLIVVGLVLLMLIISVFNISKNCSWKTLLILPRRSVKSFLRSLLCCKIDNKLTLHNLKGI
jgi:hypothetical protein